MPYTITTMPANDCRAVATLFEAREEAALRIEQITGGDPDYEEIYTDAQGCSELGDTFGPLPDGSTIVVEREDDSMDTFTLTIELGNDAMQTVADVVDALETVALDVGRSMTAMSAQSGILRDENGNTVGRWKVS